MAKEPAFMFYSGDFLVGVIGMTMEERGQYISLLCLQHQKGHISKEMILAAVGDVSDNVLNKFALDRKNLYFNKRLDEEISKRLKFVKSRKVNGAKGGRPKKNKTDRFSVGYPKNNLLENENENENINDNISSYNNNITPIKKTVKHKYGEYQNVLLTDAELEKLKDEYPDYEERIENISAYIASVGRSYKSHYATIRAWARKEKAAPQTAAQTPKSAKNKFIEDLRAIYDEEES